MKAMKIFFAIMIALIINQSANAQTDSMKMNGSKTSSVINKKYTCTMHPEVASNKSGKCNKCGMDLTKVKTYSCSMHPEVVSCNPGSCSKCGMDLTEEKKKCKRKKD